MEEVVVYERYKISEPTGSLYGGITYLFFNLLLGDKRFDIPLSEVTNRLYSTHCCPLDRVRNLLRSTRKFVIF